MVTLNRVVPNTILVCTATVYTAVSLLGTRAFLTTSMPVELWLLCVTLPLMFLPFVANHRALWSIDAIGILIAASILPANPDVLLSFLLYVSAGLSIQFMVSNVLMNQRQLLEKSRNHEQFAQAIQNVIPNYMLGKNNELHKTQEALRLSEARLSALIASAPMVLNAADRNGVITLSEGKGLASIGLKPGEVVGKTIWDLYSHRPDLLIELEAVFAGEERTWISRDDGNVVYETKAVPLRNESGEIDGIIGVSTDVTERKAAERAKGEFMANISHEIRTPMNAIIGLTDLLKETRLDGHQEELLEIVQESSHSLMSIIDDVLDFAKLKSGRVTLVEEPTNIHTLLDASLSCIQAQRLRKKIALNLSISESTPEAFIMDGQRFQQILDNLLCNAIKFTHEGAITVSIDSCKQDAREHEIQVSIQDTGIGIPAEKVELLFEGFSQVDTSVSREYGGMGLGLAISKQLAEQMGGEIWVESEEYIGSTFHFTIRAEETVRPKKPTHRTHSPHISDDALVAPYSIHDAVDAYDTWGSDQETIDNPIQTLIHAETAFKTDWPLRESQSSPSDHKFSESRFLGGSVAGENESEDREQLTVLVAEDNLVNQKVILRQLNQLGYKADIAANGFEVLMALSNQCYDLILMDIQMPDLDGLQTTQKIRNMANICQPMIIAVTANGAVVDKQKCMDIGMDGYLAKPVKLADLAESMATVQSQTEQSQTEQSQMRNLQPQLA